MPLKCCAVAELLKHSAFFLFFFLTTFFLLKEIFSYLKCYVSLQLVDTEPAEEIKLMASQATSLM
jgi:hypothetical protein